MAVSHGHLALAISSIPFGWKILELGEMGTFKNGINKDGTSFGRGYPFVNLMDVFGFNAINSNENLGLLDTNSAEQSVYNLCEGDVLFIRSSVKPSGVGLTAVIEVPLPKTVYAGFLIRYRDNGALAKNYKKHCFYESGFRRRIIAASSVSANTNINQESLKRIVIAVPPVNEQFNISAALDSIDVLIDKSNQLIAKKQDIKQATMQQLLTGKTRLPGFSGRWEEKRIGDLSHCYSGGTPSTSNKLYYGGSIPWITSSDLNKGRIKEVTGYISDLGLKNSSAKMVKKGTLLIALYGATAGVSAITEIEAAINQAVLAILPHNIEKEYLFYSLQLQKDYYIKTFTQGGQPNFSGEIVKSFIVRMPADKAEQNSIASALIEIDAEIVCHNEKLEKLKLLKQGMMQELLTGRIRLV